MSTTTVPVAHIETVWFGSRGNRCVTVVCPYNCGQIDNRRRRPATHVHGWPLDKVTVGLVSAHCGRDPRSYWVATP